MFSNIEKKRLQLSKCLDATKKSQLGQFFTPARIAEFMASLFPDASGTCRLLDAGAGMGALSAAFLERWASGGFHFDQVILDAFEIDKSLTPHLYDTLQRYINLKGFSLNVIERDFIEEATRHLSGDMFSGRELEYTHAILNPPYKKIRSNSVQRLALRRVGIETVNLYSAFVALAIALTIPGGHIIAIIPRSFCNGPYYRSFRRFILSHTSIHRIHLFDSRRKPFKDDNVLQETMIIHMQRSGVQGPVIISLSDDESFSDIEKTEYRFEDLVKPGDPENFIHIPMSSHGRIVELPSLARHSLDEIGLSVSTGPVVDFRLREYLHQLPEEGTVPLLYPAHFSNAGIMWPIKEMKKPNAIECNDITKKWLFPIGYYCTVRRFSSKEERRRIVANVVDPDIFQGASLLGFENHLNVFHEQRKGMSKKLAWGLATYLNAPIVDDYFRQFNGHTQVNATDLRCLRYPSREKLIRLGELAMERTFDPYEINLQLEALKND